MNDLIVICKRLEFNEEPQSESDGDEWESLWDDED